MSVTLQGVALIFSIVVAAVGTSWALAWAIASNRARPVLVTEEGSYALIQALDGTYQRKDLASQQYNELQRSLDAVRVDLKALQKEVRDFHAASERK